MNRKLRDRSKRAISRDWFLDEVEWLRGKTEELNARATNQTQDDGTNLWFHFLCVFSVIY